MSRLLSRRGLIGGGVSLLAVGGCGLQPVVATPKAQGPGPLFGLSLPNADPDQLAELAKRLTCGPAIVSRFVKLDSVLTVQDLVETAAGGATPLITLEPWSHVSRSGQVNQPTYSLAQIAQGKHNQDLRRLAHVFRSYGGPLYVRFAHEMNADWYPWGTTVNQNSAALYNAAWHHVHGLVSSIAPNVKWVWAPVAAWWSEAPALKPMYPGDDVVDFVGATGYGHSGTAESTFRSWFDEVRKFTTKPVLLPEIGADGPDKTAWIISLAAFFKARPDIIGFVWFNTSPSTTGATGDYRIDDRPEHLEAFQAMLRVAQVKCR